MKLNTKWQDDITIEDLKNLEDGCGLGITESDYGLLEVIKEKGVFKLYSITTYGTDKWLSYEGDDIEKVKEEIEIIKSFT